MYIRQHFPTSPPKPVGQQKRNIMCSPSSVHNIQRNHWTEQSQTIGSQKKNSSNDLGHVTCHCMVKTSAIFFFRTKRSNIEILYTQPSAQMILNFCRWKGQICSRMHLFGDFFGCPSVVLNILSPKAACPVEIRMKPPKIVPTISVAWPRWSPCPYISRTKKRERMEHVT